MDQQERHILVVTCFGHLLSHYNVLIFPSVVLPLTASLGLSMAQVLDLSFYMYLLFGLTALPWGFIADHFGPKRLMLIYFGGCGLAGTAAGIWVDSPLILKLSLAAVGCFSGIYHPVALGLISKGIRRVSLALGYNGMFGSLGLAVAPLAAGLLNYLWGVRAAFLSIGLLNLAGLGLMILLPVEEPEGREAEAAASEPKKISPFVILIVATMLGGVAYRGMTVILPAYFELKNTGLMDWLAGLWSGPVSGNLVATSLASFIYVVGILGQYVGGRVGERFEPARSYLVFHAITVPAAAAMALFSDLPLVGLALVYFFFELGMQPIENTLVAGLTPPRWHHSAYGVKFVVTFGVGSLAVKMVGAIESAWSLEAIFPALALVSLALVGCVALLIIRTRPALKRA